MHGKSEVTHNTNIIKSKHLGNNYTQSQKEEMNRKQLDYAEKCFSNFNHSAVHILARGPAIQRGVSLGINLNGLDDSLQQSCSFTFNDICPDNLHAGHAALPVMLNFNSRLFENNGSSI